MIGLGAICVIVSLYMFQGSSTTEKMNTTESDIVTEENGERAGQVTEGQESDKDAAKEQEASDAKATTAIELERDKPVHEINSDMYEWPHENIWFEGYKEPDMVIYLAQRKEWFDELVGEFQQYEGKDIYGIIGWDEEEQEVYYEPLFSEDIVAKYDKYEQFFREGIISSLDVDGDGLSFQSAQDDHEYLYYYYDENRNEETDDFLESTYIVHVAPHWWWQEPAAPH